MVDWGKRHAEEDKEVRRQTAIREDDKSKGKTPSDRNLTDRGEAITRRADAREAAKNQRDMK